MQTKKLGNGGPTTRGRASSTGGPIIMARLVLAALVFTLVFSVGPAPADDPDVPEKYMKVDQVKALLDQKKRVAFVDVRPKDQFDELHIEGAKNIPLSDLARRLGDVSKQELTVLY